MDFIKVVCRITYLLMIIPIGVRGELPLTFFVILKIVLHVYTLQSKAMAVRSQVICDMPYGNNS
jgi:hypothetical protein